jgi:hypothetical protein
MGGLDDNLMSEQLKIGADQFPYGDLDEVRTTIHGSHEVNVELDSNGRVVAVWFRCMILPFDETVIDDERAEDMRRTYKMGRHPSVDAIIFNEKP